MRLIVAALAFAFGSIGSTVPAQAQQRALQEVDARAEVASALYAASATQAAAERVADARLRAQEAEIERLRFEGRASRAQIAELEERYVAVLVQRDRAYAQEIAVFRAAVQDIASTPDGAAALARYNAGDEIGALTVLDQLVDARERARRVRAHVETAAERRRIARLALDAAQRGRLDIQSVISRYDAVVELDPAHAWDWVVFSQLHQRAGNSSAARDAALRGISAALTSDEENAAHTELGIVLQNMGDLGGARTEFEVVLNAHRRRLQLNPGDPLTLRDVSLSLSLLAGVLTRQGEFASAERALTEARQLSDQASAVTPTSIENRRFQAIRLGEQANLEQRRGNQSAARRQLEEVVSIFRQLAALQPDVRDAQRDLALSLLFLGDATVIGPDNFSTETSLREQRYSEALDLFRQLARSDPSDGQAQADLSAALTKVGDALYVAGDFSSALARYHEGLDIDLALVSADPENAELRRSLSIDYEKLATVEAERQNWVAAIAHQENVVAILQQLRTRAPANPQFQNELQAAEQALASYRARRTPVK